MPEYSSPIPPDYITSHEDAPDSPFLCTALLSLTMFSSSSYVVGGNIISGVRQAHHYTAGVLKNFIQEKEYIQG